MNINNKHIIAGALAIAIGTAFTACSHDFEYDSPAQAVTDNYNRIFVETFGQPAADQDWGFGAAAQDLTRAVLTDKWTNTHSCDWEDILKFSYPTGAIDLTNLPSNADKDGGIEGAVYVIPADFEGELNLDYKVKFNKSIVYNYGKVSGITKVNCEGVVTFYNAGTMVYNTLSGARHTIVNIGTLTIADDANVGKLYNGGHLEITDTDILNDVSIYSNGSATINMPNGGDLKAVCDIHGTLNVTGDIKVQNSTEKYICGIVATGHMENTDGPLITSYVNANDIKFDGNPIYLLPGGHIKAATTINIPNEKCYVYGHTNSVALIETVNFEFGNKKDLTHAFSDNVYFKVSGYVKIENCHAMGGSHNFATVGDYLAYDGHNAGQQDEYPLAKARVNAGNASGSPACGNAWTVETTPPPSTEDGDDDDDDDDDNEVWGEWMRIIAEDLSVRDRTDFDFNDVVFDVRFNADKSKAQICLKAAGGTLPLTVGWSGEPGVSYSEFEVHNMYGVSTGVMVNTRAKNGVDGKADVYKTLVGPFNSYNDIKIMVQKQGEWMEITAHTGEPASKILVKPTYQWCDERAPIDKVYERFTDYVKDPSVASDWYE